MAPSAGQQRPDRWVFSFSHNTAAVTFQYQNKIHALVADPQDALCWEFSRLPALGNKNACQRPQEFQRPCSLHFCSDSLHFFSYAAGFVAKPPSPPPPPPLVHRFGLSGWHRFSPPALHAGAILRGADWSFGAVAIFQLGASS